MFGLSRLSSPASDGIGSAPSSVPCLQDVKQSSAVLVPPVKTGVYAGQPASSNSEPAKPDSPSPPLFVAPAKSGGSGLFDALLMAAATGMLSCTRTFRASSCSRNTCRHALYITTDNLTKMVCRSLIIFIAAMQANSTMQVTQLSTQRGGLCCCTCFLNCSSFGKP